MQLALASPCKYTMGECINIHRASSKSAARYVLAESSNVSRGQDSCVLQYLPVSGTSDEDPDSHHCCHERQPAAEAVTLGCQDCGKLQIRTGETQVTSLLGHRKGALCHSAWCLRAKTCN